MMADSISGLQHLERELGDPQVSQVVDLIQSHTDQIKDYINTHGSDSVTANQLEGMCELLSRFMNQILKKEGFKAVLLQGEIEIEKDSWLEHQISLVMLQNYWMTIDLSAGQLKKYSNAELLVLISSPNKHSLKKALVSAYGWWAAD